MAATSKLLNSIDSEKSILGSVMVDPTIFPRISSFLTPEDFFDASTRKVYISMLALFSNGVEINVKSVWNELLKQGGAGLTEGELREYLDFQAGGEAVSGFAMQVSEFSGHRLLNRELEKLTKLAAENNGNLSDMAGLLNTLARRVNEKGVKQDIVYGQQMVDEYVEMLRRKKSEYLLTGIKEVDSQVFDLEPKEIVFVAARPGVGKTALLLQSAHCNLISGYTVGFLSMEMSRPKLLNRLVSARSRISSTEIRQLGDDFSGNERLVEAIKWFGTSKLYIDDAGPWTLQSVTQKIRKLVYDKGVNIIYVDYIGLIGADSIGNNRNVELTVISRTLKNLASELSIPIYAASQLNREVTKRAGGRPMLSDMRDSGSLEQDGSIVSFLYTDTSGLPGADISAEDVDEYLKGEDVIEVKFEVRKQRNGPTFIEDLMFNKPHGTFHAKSKYLATYDE